MIFLFKQVIFQIFSGSMLINPPGCIANLDNPPPVCWSNRIPLEKKKNRPRVHVQLEEFQV